MSRQAFMQAPGFPSWMAEPEIAAALARARADAARYERAREHALDELCICRIALWQIVQHPDCPPDIATIAHQALEAKS